MISKNIIHLHEQTHEINLYLINSLGQIIYNPYD